MPTTEENCLVKDMTSIKGLGILAGGGDLPFILLESCEELGIEPFVIAFDGHTDKELTDGREHIWTRLGAVGSILKTLNNRGIKDLCLIGAIRRPSLAELSPDLKAAAFFSKAGSELLGDDGLLKALKVFLEEEGFTLHGAHEFAGSLLCPAGVIGKFKPTKGDYDDISRGIGVLEGMSDLDIGQAVIVQEGLVLGVEAVEGTDELIKRCASLRRKGRGGVLVKLCKTGQARDLDLPTIGPRTIELLASYGFAGAAFHAGQSLLIKKQEVAQIADKNKIFVIGLPPHSA